MRRNRRHRDAIRVVPHHAGSRGITGITGITGKRKKKITPVPVGAEVTGGERDDELSSRSSAAADPRNDSES